MGTIGGILIAVGVIAMLVFWIMAIVKAFKKKDTLWGVLNIFIPICGLIWFFLNGQKKLGIYWIVALVVYIIGFVLAGGAAAASSGGIPQLQP